MSDVLHAATIGAFQQILPSVLGWLDKAEAHCREQGLAESELALSALAPDMWPFSKQIVMCNRHSAGAIAAVRRGLMNPDPAPPPEDFATLRREITDAMALVDAVRPGELAAIAGRDMAFEFSTRRMEFTVEDFLLTFSLPNFYFHASMAYAILRGRGLPVGKGDFLGKLRLKG